MVSPSFRSLILLIALSTASLTPAISARSQGRSAEDALKGYIVSRGVAAAIDLYGFGETMEACVESAATTSSQSTYNRSVSEVKEGFEAQYKKGWVFGQTAAWSVVGNEIAAYIAAHPNSQSRMCQFMSDIGLQANGVAPTKIGCSGASQSGAVLNQSGPSDESQGSAGPASESTVPQTAAGTPDPNDPYDPNYKPNLGSLKEVGNSQLSKLAREDGYERVEDWKRQELGLNARDQIYQDTDTGKLYTLPRSGGGIPQPLNITMPR